LLQFNGGKPVFGGFDYVGRDEVNESTIVRRFFGVHQAADSDLEAIFREIRGHLPQSSHKLLPIAMDLPWDNLICLVTEGEKIGSICYWDRQPATQNSENSETANVFWIKPSFQEFLDSLY
jgi:hypothetical protein